eukprot:10767336-Ditylum_brightwellii.AAC.1
MASPGVHAAPVATKGSVRQPKPQRRPRQRGSPPQTRGGAPASLPSVQHRFLEGKGVGRYYTQTRETEHVM